MSSFLKSAAIKAVKLFLLAVIFVIETSRAENITTPDATSNEKHNSTQLSSNLKTRDIITDRSYIPLQKTVFFPKEKLVFSAIDYQNVENFISMLLDLAANNRTLQELEADPNVNTNIYS